MKYLAASLVVAFSCSASAADRLPTFFAYQIYAQASAVSVTAISERGQLVGYASLKIGETTAFITGPRGVGIFYLGALDGLSSSANDVNSAGQVAGYIVRQDGSLAGFITDANATNMRILPVPPTATSSFALRINEAGQVLGSYTQKPDAGSSVKTFFVASTTNNERSDISLPGISQPQITALNSSGQLAGYGVFEDDFRQQAFLLGPGIDGVKKIGNVGDNGTVITTMNDDAQVAGYAVGFGDLVKPVVSNDEGESLNVRPTLGGDQGAAYAIDDSGRIAGRSTLTKNNRTARAFVAPHHGRLYDLNKLIKNLPDDVILHTVVDINKSGQMAVTTDNGKSYIVCPTENCL